MKPNSGVFWLALGVTTGFFLAGSLFWGLTYQSQHPVQTEHHSEPQGAPQSAEGEPRGSRTAPFFVEVIPTPKSAEERAQEAEDREEKKTADRWLVRWTAMLFAATVGLILATGVLGYFGFHQARDMKASIAAAKEANQISRENFLLSQRPWIAIEIRQRRG